MKAYIAIDLKSFYASVECRDRSLDPLNTNLVVADESRSDNTICLAVSPPLKAMGVSSRPRLFEAKQQVKAINEKRGRYFKGKSFFASELKENKSLAVSFIIAPPRMARYIAVSSAIYEIYLKYIAKEDIHVYSIDVVFIDAEPYLNTYNTTPYDLAKMIILDIVHTTGITATAGIGTNLYLAKVAMDIIAKHTEADEYGVRIASLDEMSYREKLWSHKPLTDFWRIGPGYLNRLARLHLFTMGGIARCSLEREEVLYRQFGVNAELLIDHAWGYESCTMRAIKAYKSLNHSLSNGQVLSHAYTFDQAKTVVREMSDALAFDMVEKRVGSNQVVLSIDYDSDNLSTYEKRASYSGLVYYDHYGRPVPKHAHGSLNLDIYTSSSQMLMEASNYIYNKITDRNLLIRRINITACNVISEEEALNRGLQLDLFMKIDLSKLKREHSLQETSISIKNRYGKNAILRGSSFLSESTTRERNLQIGGHKA